MTNYVKKMTRTFVRTEKTMNAYKEYMDDLRLDKVKGFIEMIDDGEIEVLKEFKYGKILANNFPYDAIAEKSHLLFIKRKVRFDGELLSLEEKLELEELKKGYIKENYDVLGENLPSGQTVPGYFHLHLIKMKREEI